MFRNHMWVWSTLANCKLVDFTCIMLIFIACSGIIIDLQFHLRVLTLKTCIKGYLYIRNIYKYNMMEAFTEFQVR